MLITCWSSKGGSGTTVVAAALAALLAREAGAALLVDLVGDLPAALGVPEPDDGLAGWTGPTRRRSDPPGVVDLAAKRARADLAGLEVDVGGGVRLLPRGPGPLADEMGPALAGFLAGAEPVVVDAGVIGPWQGSEGLAVELAGSATVSLLVIRPCFLALRRAVAAPLRASGVVLVDEPQRVLGRSDVESALGIPVVASVPWDPAVARRVDAGLLGSALPPAIARALRRAVAAGPPRAPSASRRTPAAAAEPRLPDPGAGGGTEKPISWPDRAAKPRVPDPGDRGGTGPPVGWPDRTA